MSDILHSRRYLSAAAEKAEKEAKASGEKEDYKGESKFATHLKASAGVSAFAKTRTLDHNAGASWF